MGSVSLITKARLKRGLFTLALAFVSVVSTSGCLAMFQPKITLEDLDPRYGERGLVHDDGSLERWHVNFSHCPVVGSYTKRLSYPFQRDKKVEVWIRDCGE
jgi:hypothetical protein